MILVITKIERKKSRYGGDFFYVFFRTPSKSQTFYSCIYTKLRNYRRWEKVLNVGTTLSNLRLVNGKDKLIDADSNFKVVEER